MMSLAKNQFNCHWLFVENQNLPMNNYLLLPIAHCLLPIYANKFKNQG
jgi:hypothetical protein